VESGTIDALLKEERRYEPPEDFARGAIVADRSVYDRADQDIEGFWAEAAGELDWFKKWDRVLEWNVPWAKWFVGGELNVAYNCVDRHAATWRKTKAAIIWEGEPGEERVLTYRDLYREVNRAAAALRSLGIKKGDRVAIYMPMIPELPIAMLACARLGATHSVIFGGFSPESIRDRVNDCEAKLVITADAGYRRGSVLALKDNVDEAIEGTPTVEHTVVVSASAAKCAKST